MRNRLRELRVAAGLTLETVAERADTTAQQISRLEKGLRKLTPEWMQRVASALGVAPSELLVFESVGAPAAAPHGMAEPTQGEPAALGLTWQVNPERMARAYQMATAGLAVLPGHQPDPRRLMQVTLLIYDELTATEAPPKP